MGERRMRRQVPKGTRLHQLKKVGGFDLGIYYHEDETHKWGQNLDKFERLVRAMTEQLDRMKNQSKEV